MTRILIAEDDHDLRATLRAALESEGYEVEAVPDGEKAIHAHEARPADLLITDLFMPDRDGLETVEYFRAHNPEMPIVAISGWTSLQQTDHLGVAEIAGANAVFRKPFRMGELIEQLKSLTSRT